jgi:hypothetical protein
MEWIDEDGDTQESSRGGARQVRWARPQRGETAGQQREPRKGWAGQKQPEDTRLSTQRASSAASSRQAVMVAMALICGRFGDLAIGMVEAGLLYGRGRTVDVWR